MKKPSTPLRRPKLWLRLAFLYISIGLLALSGAVLGQGFGLFGISTIESQALGAPRTAAPVGISDAGTLAVVTPTAQPISAAIVAAPSASPAPDPASPTPFDIPTSHPRVVGPAQILATPAAPLSSQGAAVAGMGGPARLPRTGGAPLSTVLALLGLGLVSFGMLLCVLARRHSDVCDEKE